MLKTIVSRANNVMFSARLLAARKKKGEKIEPV